MENRIIKESVFQEPPLIRKGGRVPEAEPEEEPGKPKASPSPGETSPATPGCGRSSVTLLPLDMPEHVRMV